MNFSTYTLGIDDFGPYHCKFIQLKLVREDGEEKLFIKYPHALNFVPCSAMARDNKIHVWGAMIGNSEDIKIKQYRWLEILNSLKSKIEHQYWKEKIERVSRIAG